MNEELAISIVKKEVETYRDPTVYITDKVSFAVKPLIRQLRKNYWGVFDDPTDKITGRKKIWVPLTQMVVDNTRKNVDLDTKDINFYANVPGRFGVTQLLRAFVRSYLDRTFYGEDMDDVTFNVCVDPVSVMQIYSVKQNSKTAIKRRIIDPLNVYIDPNALTIQEAYRFTHRALMSKDQLSGMGWKNTDKAVADTRPDQYEMTSLPRTTKYVDVYEMWGKVPKEVFTGNPNDQEEVEAQIVVSGIGRGNCVLHLLKENKNADIDGNILKPFEEARYMKVPWSFYGISPAMKVMDIQEWINTIVNLRINKNTVAQLGLFKVRAGSNINTQALTRLVSNGVIKVTNMDDLDNFQIQEAGPGSYKDEETAKFWATEVTSAYDIVRGALPSTTTATAAVIQDKNSKTSFVIVRDSLGRFNEKVIQRHILPTLPKMMKEEGVVRYFSDMDEINKLREGLVSYYAYQELDKVGTVPTEFELTEAMDSARRKLEKGGDIFFDIVEDVLVDGIETRVQVTNEKMDTATVARNLLELIQVVPQEAQGETAAQIFDVLGLQAPKTLRSAPKLDNTQSYLGDLQIPGQLGESVAANTMQNVGRV
jgi:hypothetical protein